MRVRRRQSRRARPGCRDATLAKQRAVRGTAEPRVRCGCRAATLIPNIFFPIVAFVSAATPRSACSPTSGGGACAQERASMEEV